MSLKEGIGIIFWFLIGITVSLASIRLGIGRPSNPGTGFMPFISGGLLIFLSLLLAFLELRKGRNKSSIPFSLSVNKNLIVMLLCLFGFMLVLETLGYLISIGLLFFVLLEATAPKKWLNALLWSIVVSSCSYLIFSTLLKCHFPRGIFNLG